MTLTVRTLTTDEHLEFVERRASEGAPPSFLQVPSWGEVKAEWRSESVGWTTTSGDIVGATLALYPQVT